MNALDSQTFIFRNRFQFSSTTTAAPATTTNLVADRFKLKKKAEMTYRASGMFSIAARLSG